LLDIHLKFLETLLQCHQVDAQLSKGLCMSSKLFHQMTTVSAQENKVCKITTHKNTMPHTFVIE